MQHLPETMDTVFFWTESRSIASHGLVSCRTTFQEAFQAARKVPE